MVLFKRIISLLIIAAMVLSLVACTGKNPGTASGDADSYREPKKAETVVQDNWEDTDGDFDYKTESWSGPEGYVIVIPTGDGEMKTLAEYLQDYYTRVHKVTLKIVTDSTSAVEKEILIGNTNRKESKADLKEGELKVALEGNKLVLVGGHTVTTEAAVKRFTRLFPDKNEAFTFKLETDFTVAPTTAGLDDYKFVWGDEFEDWYDLDFGKWDFRAGMSGNAAAKISTDRDVIEVSDGRLKIRSINYFNENEPDVLFKMPYSTATHTTFNFLYGYAEIRARIPFYKGAWPSWWGGSATQVIPRNPLWHSEIDVFEIFGSEDTVTPNIHKWYDDYDYAGIHGLDASERHSQYTSTTHPKKTYKFAKTENLDREYHTYGYEWTPELMNFYVDGEKYCTMDIVNSWDVEPNMVMFQEPQYSQFNNHVFVNEAGFKPNLIYENMHLLPSDYFIDYYRFYQRSDGKSKIWTDTSKRGQSVYDNREIDVEEVVGSE